MDTLKTYFVEVLLKKITPKVSAALISAAITFLIAHQEFMEQMGITYYPNFNGTWHGAAPTGQLIVLEFDTLGKWGAAGLVVLVTAGWSFFQHHAGAVVLGKPQSGDMRKEPELIVSGGGRPIDPVRAP